MKAAAMTNAKPAKTKTLAIEEIPMPHNDPDFDEASFQEESDQLEQEQEISDAAPTAAETSAPAVSAPISKLEFIDGVPGKTVQLKYGFKKDGKPVKSIFVRRLAIGVVGDLIDGYGSAEIPKWEIYALMTDYSAADLRGLIDEDGEALTEVAYDFLPRAFRMEAAPDTI